MKKIRSFSLFLALLLLFSFTSCENESGEITMEYTATLDTGVITDKKETTAPETTSEPETEALTESLNTEGVTKITTPAETTTAPEPETTAEPEVTTVPEPETTAEPEVTTVPEPETTAEPEVTTAPEPETTAEPEATTVPEPETTAEPEVTTLPEPETTAEPEVTTVPEPETTAEPEETTASEPETTAEPEETTEPEPEEDYNPAPDFTVYDQQGNPVKLSDMIGKPVVLNFWASWCGPCRSEMPDFDEVWRELGDEVVFMIVNLTDGTYETVASAQSFIDSMGYSFPVYFDITEEAAYEYQIVSIPTTFFISARGNLIAYAEGALDGETLKYGISLIHN